MKPRSTVSRRTSVPAGLALALAGFLGLLAAPPASAVLLPTAWTVTAMPMTLTEGSKTHVHVTVTGGTDPIGCVVVSVPSGFTVLAVKVINAPMGTYWTASQAGTAPTTATFAASVSGALTLLATATFDVKVVATSGPLAAWTTSAYQDDTCTSTSVGPPLLPLQPFVIIPLATPTLPPSPTATPNPTPSPTPTPSIDVSPSPSPTPTPTAKPTARPPAATPTGRPPTPDPSARPSPTATQSASPAPTDTAAVVAGGGPVAGPPGDGAVTIGGPLGGTHLAMGDLGSVDALTFAWLVPGALLGLPGLLILLVLAAQVGMGTLFVPLTRRVFADRGEHPA